VGIKSECRGLVQDLGIRKEMGLGFRVILEKVARLKYK
jgi:hypothetical protein